MEEVTYKIKSGILRGGVHPNISIQIGGPMSFDSHGRLYLKVLEIVSFNLRNGVIRSDLKI
jgi:hypothetical protein